MIKLDKKRIQNANYYVTSTFEKENKPGTKGLVEEFAESDGPDDLAHGVRAH